MENLKLLRKVRKISQQKTQRELRENNAASALFGRLNYDDEIISHTTEDHFHKLPDSLILKIFKYISRPAILRYACVCKRWNTLMSNESLWKQYDASNKIINAEILIKLLNRGVRVFGLGRSEIRKSLKKSLNQAASRPVILSTQLDFCLQSKLRLECLDLTNAIIDTKTINVLLKHCKSLKKVSLESLDLDVETFQFLSFNPGIVALNLSMCKGVSVDGLILILNTLKSLKCFNIAWTNLGRESVVLVCKHMPISIKKLNLSGCKTTLLDSDVKNLVISCPNLKQLDISDSPSLTNLSIEHIAGSLKLLEHLACSRCYSITPSSYFVLGALSNLIALDLFNILNEKSFEILKENIGSLLYLNRYMFSSIARPIATYRTSNIWSHRLAEITLLEHHRKKF